MSSPVALTFGPWAPDLGNNGVEIGPLGGTVPAADVLNVYYSNSAYRCLPGPSSIGPSLGIPITNAVNWYDNSTDTEEVFAATANGIYMLVDGSWSQVPVQANSSIGAIGLSIPLNQGAPIYLTYAPSFASGTSSAHIFAAANLKNVGAGASLVWSATSPSGGTFSVYNGQGTTGSQAEVTGVSPGTTATCNYECTVTLNGTPTTVTAPLSYGYMTGSLSGNATGIGQGTVTTNAVTASESAGVGLTTYVWSAPAGVTIDTPSDVSTTFSSSANASGPISCAITDVNGTTVFPAASLSIAIKKYYGSITPGNVSSQTGFIQSNFGSVSPGSDSNGHAIAGLYYDSSESQFFLAITSASSLGQSYFDNLTIGSNTYSSASASYIFLEGTSLWSWSEDPGFVVSVPKTWYYL